MCAFDLLYSQFIYVRNVRSWIRIRCTRTIQCMCRNCNCITSKHDDRQSLWCISFCCVLFCSDHMHICIRIWIAVWIIQAWIAFYDAEWVQLHFYMYTISIYMWWILIRIGTFSWSSGSTYMRRFKMVELLFHLNIMGMRYISANVTA